MSAQQNLVYNGDFEIYDTCPTQASYPSLLEINKCKGWYPPTLGTSDYFNACANGNWGSNGNIWVPNNFIGYQNPYNGVGYIGLFSFQNGIATQCIYREYVQTKLITPLIAGKQYVLEYYVSMANYQAAVNSISALFTVNKVTTNNDCPIIANPQIKNKGAYITDTLHWTRIAGTFTANGGEEYLTLGFFEDTANLTGVLPLLPDSITFGSYSSYYYIDGVNLTEQTCDINIPNIFTPNSDGINDLLYFNICATIENITIYNRWGNVIFKSEKAGNNNWNGRTTSGEECSDGNYFYILQSEEKTYKGSVQLIR